MTQDEEGQIEIQPSNVSYLRLFKSFMSFYNNYWLYILGSLERFERFYGLEVGVAQKENPQAKARVRN